MLSQIRKLVGHSAVYGLGLVGTSISALILTPMLLHAMHPAEYGMMEVLSVLTSMLYTVLLLGVASVLIKIYVNDCKTEEERRLLITSIILFAAVIGTLLAVTAWIFAKPIAARLLDDSRHAALVQLAASASGLLLIQQMAVLTLRARQKPGRFAAVTLTQITLQIVVCVYLVLVRGMGVMGVQLAMFVACLVSMLVGLIMVREDLVARFSSVAVKRVLVLSLPMVPVSIAPWVLNASDRYFLKMSHGLAETGLYAVGYKIGMLGLMIMINAFQFAWSPFFFANSQNPRNPELCARVMKCYTIVLITSGLAFSVYAPEILRVISNKPEYWSAGWIVPYIALSYVFYAVQFFAIPFFVRHNQGARLSLIMVGAVVFNLTANALLIPRYGISGAIAATLSTFVLTASASIIVANKIYPVRYHTAGFIGALAAAAVVYIASILINQVEAPIALMKLSALPLYVVLLFILRVFDNREIEAMRSMSDRLLQRLHPASR